MTFPTIAPGGAVCAIHSDRAASQVCERCGNFMCAECSGEGRSARCPSCAGLEGHRFPFTRDDFDFGRVWDYVFEAWKREWVMLSVAALLFVGIALAAAGVAQAISAVIAAVSGVQDASQNPMGKIGAFAVTFLLSNAVGTAFNILAQSVGLLGLYRVIFDVLIGRKADVGRMFSQLRKVPTFVLSSLAMMIAVGIPTLIYFAMVALLVLASVGVQVSQVDPAHWGSLLTASTVAIIAGATVLYVAFALVVFLPLSFFSQAEIALTDCGPLEAIRRAWLVASGNRLAAIGYVFVSGLVMMIGLLACCIGVLPAMPLGYGLVLAFYLAARNGLNLPKPDHS